MQTEIRPNRESIDNEIKDLKLLCIKSEIVLLIVGAGGLVGAVNGFLGYNVLDASGNPIGPHYNMQNAVASNAIGGAILGIILTTIKGMVIVCASDGCSERTSPISEWNPYKIKNLTYMTIGMLPVNIVSGIFESLTGGAVLGLIPYTKYENADAKFSTAIGAAGGALSVAAIFVPLLVFRTLYLLYKASEIARKCKTLNCASSKTTASMLHAFSSRNNKPNDEKLKQQTNTNYIGEREILPESQSVSSSSRLELA